MKLRTFGCSESIVAAEATEANTSSQGCKVYRRNIPLSLSLIFERSLAAWGKFYGVCRLLWGQVLKDFGILGRCKICGGFWV